MGTVEFWRAGDWLQVPQPLSGRKATAARSSESKKMSGEAVCFQSALRPLASPWQTAAQWQLEIRGWYPRSVQASSRKARRRPAKEKGCCAYHPSPRPPPLPAHRPCRFPGNGATQCCQNSEQLERIQNEIYVPLQLPKWLQLWRLNPLMC